MNLKEELEKQKLNPSKTTEPTVDTKATLQSIDDQILIAKKQIELDEILKKRDLPEVLTKKEQTLSEKEQSLILREKVCSDKELALTLRENKVVDSENILKQQEQATSENCRKRLHEANKQIDDRVKILLELNKAIEETEIHLDGQLDVISQYPEAIKPWFEQVQKLYKMTEIIAIKQNNLSENTKGKQSDWHTTMANRAWNLSDGLKKVVEWLNK